MGKTIIKGSIDWFLTVRSTKDRVVHSEFHGETDQTRYAKENVKHLQRISMVEQRRSTGQSIQEPTQQVN